MFTIVHVIISLIGIISGFIVLFGMLTRRRLVGWTAVFLTTTVLTSVTGFFFHSSFGPAHVVGLISLVVLAAAIAALCVFRLAGFWRWIYVGGAVAALYLNVFVAVIQAFQKVPVLQPLAPTQSASVTQIVVLAIFVALGIAALWKFSPDMNAR